MTGALALTAVTLPSSRSPRGEFLAPFTLFQTPPPMAPMAKAPPMSSKMRCGQGSRSWTDIRTPRARCVGDDCRRGGGHFQRTNITEARRGEARRGGARRGESTHFLAHCQRCCVRRARFCRTVRVTRDFEESAVLGQRAGGLHDATRAGRGVQVGWTDLACDGSEDGCLRGRAERLVWV